MAVETDSPIAAADEQNGRQQQLQPPPGVHLYGWRLYLVQFSLYLGLILSIMDSSAVSTALVTIGDHFNDFTRIQWVVLAYMLTYLGFALTFSRMSDVIGRKWATITALIFIGAFSIGCGWAQTIQQLIAFRALQGVGGAGLYSMAFIVLPEMTPPENIPVMSGLIGGVTIVSAVLGPVIGGVITTHSTWRWVFWFNIPVVGTILVPMIVFCPDFKYQGRMKWRQFDFIGCLIYLVTCVLLITALQEAGAGSIAWQSAAFIVCMILAGLAFVGFASWIAFLSGGKHSTMPLFPARIIKHRIMLSTVMVSTCIGFVFYSILVQLPERFQIVNGDTAEISGVSLLALSGPSAVGSFLGGALSSKKNNTFSTLIIGCSLILLGNGLFHTVGPSHSVPSKAYGFEAIMGLGFGMIFSTTTVLIKLHAEREDAASAQGLMSQGRLLGGNLGLAIATVVLNQQLVSDLSGIVPSDELDNLRHSLLAMSSLTAQQAAVVRQAFADAFKTQLVINMGVAGAAFVFSMYTWERHPTTFAQVLQQMADDEDASAANSTAVAQINERPTASST
ncbi:MFS multidrug transporter, putative [Talaromyces stipitatus ATCC 10500]|uniref:MFS multidrug transporter, putative n=1 Tax=Talaromyces stipitatus (strain ATCC 10500 / CBS 375.48 / QM 6759 / NRRL 1006) TaxID=441959 RepID=B8MPM5_TALSN|nr:MFS multidrug transporter, putative [Talaromyces stipitatus ATCC 10500]EED14464.1 MFS multidrug transporter, putative [Talaromyces stipitatus ATCC 10500]